MRTSPSPAQTWSRELIDQVALARENLLERCPSLIVALDNAGLLPELDRVLATSEFAHRVLLGRAPLVEAALSSGRLLQPDRPRVEDVLEAADDPGRALRMARDRELFLICWHDLAGRRSTDQTLMALSDLADRLIRIACELACAQLANDQRLDISPPVILAMGKLGGHELNFSSDVDLVFLHPAGGHDATLLYGKLAKRIIALLDARTDEGFVYRVDVRLRPFGSTGALSLGLSAFESYLQSHARDWERYAYIKARALTGSDADLEQLSEVLRAYVYRRYLDFGVFEALRNTKGLIETDVRRQDADDDIKRGAGGIREIEFVVQALQLLRGGQQRELQVPSLLQALSQLERLGWLDAVAAPRLRDAYLFLRHVENRLQSWSDAQTHRLPTDDIGRSRLAVAMGFPGWAALAAVLATHRDHVSTVFHALLGSDSPAPTQDEGRDLWSLAAEPERLTQRLEALSLSNPQTLTDQIVTLLQSRFVGRLGRTGRERLDRLMPSLLDDILRVEQPGVAFERVALILAGVGRRSAYFALLNENPAARQRLVGLCEQSARIARDVAEKPLLLDSLIDPGIVQLATRDAHTAQLRAALHGIDRDDLELLIDTLSQFKSSAVFEVAVADLSSQLPVMKVSDQLTWIAQSVIGEVLRVAGRDARARYGEPPGDDSDLCVIAYGKLGGIELGYGSDLDLVFVYTTDAPEGQSDGPRPLPTSMYFARIVQRFVHIASATTRSGSLYDVDMRLRPSGNSGPLCSRLSAFGSYQRDRAWTWEHQALLRARAVAGDERLGERFEALRQEILCTRRDHQALAHDVTTMRARMYKAHKPARDRFHVKHDRGGLTDVEFVVQYFLLAHAHQEPGLVAFSDHMRQLDALVEAGCLPSGVGEDLQSIYLTYRTRLHRAALNESQSHVSPERFAAEAERVRAVWVETFGP